MQEGEYWEQFKIDSTFMNHFKTNFPYKRLLSTDSLAEKMDYCCVMSNAI